MLTRRSAIATCAAAMPAFAWAADDALAGVWRGTLTAGSLSLRLRIEITVDGGALLTSVDQAGARVAGTAQRAADAVTLVFPGASGRFAGRLVDDRMEGVWTGARGDTALALVRGGSDVVAESPPAAPLTDERLSQLRKANGLVALTAAAQRGSGAVRLWADGERRLGGAEPVTVEDEWHLGSISKSMLATVAGRLVQQRRLAWSDTLGRVLGKDLPEMHSGYRDATLLHLLSHRAGLPDNLPLVAMKSFARSTDGPVAQRTAYLKLGLAMPPSAPLGSTMIYSNVGYVAAAALMQARTGRSWDDLMRAELFRPLRLTSAGFGPPGPGQPVGHGAFMGGPFQAHPADSPNADLPAVMAPAGAVHMSLADLTTYLRAHRDRGVLLKPAVWERLQTAPFGGDYALGWVVGPGGVLTHNGSNTLWIAEARIDRANGLVAAAASNDGRPAAQGGVRAALNGAVAAIA